MELIEVANIVYVLKKILYLNPDICPKTWPGNRFVAWDEQMDFYPGSLVGECE